MVRGNLGFREAPEGHVAYGVAQCTVRVGISYMTRDVNIGSGVKKLVSIDFGKLRHGRHRLERERVELY